MTPPLRILLSLLTVLATPTAARAQTNGEVMTARDIAAAGVDAFDAGEYERAAQQLGDAYEVVQVPTIALYRARALVALGRLVEAYEVYNEATILQVETGQIAAQRAAQREAKQERDALVPRIPKILVSVQGANREVVHFTVDDHEISGALLAAGHAVDPGEHVVEGSVEGQVARAVLTLEEGERSTVELTFGPADGAPAAAASTTAPTTAPPSTPPPAAPEAGPDSAVGSAPGWQRHVGWAAVGTGGALLIAGTIAGLDAARRRPGLRDDGCLKNGSCYSDQSNDVRPYNRSVRIANVGLIGGGLVTGAGAVLLLVTPQHGRHPDQTRRWQPWIGYKSAGVTGNF